MIIAIVVELIAVTVATVWTHDNVERLESFLGSYFKDSLRSEYKQAGLYEEAIDSIQNIFQCCGVDGPMDWRNSTYSNSIVVQSFNDKFFVPPSCCRNELTCDDYREILNGKVDTNFIYDHVSIV